MNAARRPPTVPPEPPGPVVPDGEHAGLVLDARLHLLDRQVLDRDGVPVTTVDDLELAVSGAHGSAGNPGEPPTGDDLVVIAALLTGPVLLTRIAGGRPPSSRMMAIPWRHVTQVGTTIRLGVGGDALDATWFERWLRDRIIRRIPGGRHDPE